MNTPEGARKAAAINKAKYGPDFYKRIGAAGGKAKNKTPKGFASMPKAAVSAAGRKGGSMGKKGRPGSKLSPETLELLQLQRMQMERTRV